MLVSLKPHCWFTTDRSLKKHPVHVNTGRMQKRDPPSRYPQRERVFNNGQKPCPPPGLYACQQIEWVCDYDDGANKKCRAKRKPPHWELLINDDVWQFTRHIYIHNTNDTRSSPINEITKNCCSVGSKRISTLYSDSLLYISGEFHWKLFERNHSTAADPTPVINKKTFDNLLGR